MYLVSFPNLGQTRVFRTETQAIEHMKSSGLFSDLITTAGHILGHYSPISGFNRS